MFIAEPAHAVTYYLISGTLKDFSGVNSGAEIDACKTDCVTNKTAPDDYAYVDSTTGKYTLYVPSTGVYKLAVSYLDLDPGYKGSDGARVPDGYLYKAAGATHFSVGTTFAGALSVTVTASNINGSSPTPAAAPPVQFGQAIHDPQSQFNQVTPGTIGQQPCSGHTTTFQPTPFSDLPSNATVAYQWYVGSSSTHTAIAGATGTSYTSTDAQVGQELYVEMKATAPDRVAFVGIGDIGTVGSGASCVPPPPVITVSSWGARKGRAVHGKKVAIVGAKAPGAGASYNWMLNGKVVHHGASYKLPAKAKRKKLTVQVVFTEAGYAPASHVTSFGKVK